MHVTMVKANPPVCEEPQHVRLDGLSEAPPLLHVSHNAMKAMGVDDWYRHDVMRVLTGLGAARARGG